MGFVAVSYLGKNKRVAIAGGTTVEKLLGKMGINAESVVVRINSEFAADDEKLKSGNRVELIKVVSGG